MNEPRTADSAAEMAARQFFEISQRHGVLTLTSWEEAVSPYREHLAAVFAELIGPDGILDVRRVDPVTAPTCSDYDRAIAAIEAAWNEQCCGNNNVDACDYCRAYDDAIRSVAWARDHPVTAPTCSHTARPAHRTATHDDEGTGR